MAELKGARYSDKPHANQTPTPLLLACRRAAAMDAANLVNQQQLQRKAEQKALKSEADAAFREAWTGKLAQFKVEERREVEDRRARAQQVRPVRAAGCCLWAAGLRAVGWQHIQAACMAHPCSHCATAAVTCAGAVRHYSQRMPLIKPRFRVQHV